MIFPRCDSSQALQALMHVRAALALVGQQSGVAFTFSGGVTDSHAASSGQVQLRIADAGPMACKQNGRNQISIGELVPAERRGVTPTVDVDAS